MRSFVAGLLCVVLITPGCATTRTSSGPHAAPLPSQSDRRVDPGLMAEYIRQLPVGSRVKINRAGGKMVRGTLLKRDADPIIVQPRTRLPEAPIEIAVADILSLEIERHSSAGPAIAVGLAAGAGAALGFLLLLAVIFAD